MLDLKLLQSFREVAVRKSFSAAAHALSFTQPAVSQHVARLEKALDTPLLVREPRGVGLTPAGEALLRHAEEILGGVVRAAHPGVDLLLQAIEPGPGVDKVSTGALDAAMVIESLFVASPSRPGVEL